MDLKEEDCSSQNNSFDNNYNSHSNNDLFLFSKEKMGNGNEFFNFETEFKKVFNSKDTFGHIIKEEEMILKQKKTKKSDLIKKKYLN